MLTLNQESFDKLLESDLAYMESLPDDLDKRHIVSILRTCSDYFYSEKNVWDEHDKMRARHTERRKARKAGEE